MIRLSKNILLKSIIVILTGLPIMAWIFVKPVRVVAPQLTGVSCINERICIDDILHQNEALALYENALEFVTTSVAPIKRQPRLIFCATATCFDSFGLSKPSGHTFGTFGIVIGPRGWKPHYVRHEMIHHLQAEKLGNLKLWLGPKWFFEGMAYSLSEDPRSKLPAPFEQYRAQFGAWYHTVDKRQIWLEASKL